MDWLNTLASYLVPGLTRGAMYALIAIGYTLVYGVLQLINFAHADVFMFGSFGAYLATQPIWDGTNNHGPFMVAIVIFVGLLTGGLVGAGVAWCLERVAYRTLRERGAPKLAFLISAIGASFFLSQFAGKMFNRFRGNQYPGYADELRNNTLVSFGPFTISLMQVIIIVVAVVMMFSLDRVVNKTKLGMSIRAVAEDAPTAALMGINIDKTIARTFLIGGALAGIAGFLFGSAFSVFNTMGFEQGNKAFAAAVLGGIGNVRGAMIGGFILGLVEALIPPLPFIGIEWTDVVAFVVLVLILVFRPTGILGEKLGRAA